MSPYIFLSTYLKLKNKISVQSQNLLLAYLTNIITLWFKYKLYESVTISQNMFNMRIRLI